MRKWVDREQSLNDFGPKRLGTLLTCVDTAWETYDSQMRPRMPLASFTCIANCMHNLVAHEVRSKMDGLPGIVIRDKTLPVNGRFLVEVDRQYILQVRKLTEDFQTRNIATTTSDAFDRQQLIEGLPDYPRLTLGYKLDDFRTAVTGIYIAYNIGDENQWWHDLRTGEYGEGFGAILFPTDGRPSAADQEEAEDERKRREIEGDEDSNPNESA